MILPSWDCQLWQHPSRCRVAVCLSLYSSGAELETRSHVPIRRREARDFDAAPPMCTSSFSYETMSLLCVFSFFARADNSSYSLWRDVFFAYVRVLRSLSLCPWKPLGSAGGQSFLAHPSVWFEQGDRGLSSRAHGAMQSGCLYVCISMHCLAAERQLPVSTFCMCCPDRGLSLYLCKSVLFSQLPGSLSSLCTYSGDLDRLCTADGLHRSLQDSLSIAPSLCVSSARGGAYAFSSLVGKAARGAGVAYHEHCNELRVQCGITCKAMTEPFSGLEVVCPPEVLTERGRRFANLSLSFVVCMYLP